MCVCVCACYYRAPTSLVPFDFPFCSTPKMGTHTKKERTWRQSFAPWQGVEVACNIWVCLELMLATLLGAWCRDSKNRKGMGGSDSFERKPSCMPGHSNFQLKKTLVLPQVSWGEFSFFVFWAPGVSMTLQKWVHDPFLFGSDPKETLDTWSLLLTLETWLVLTPNKGVMDPFLKGQSRQVVLSSPVAGISSPFFAPHPA